MMIIYPGDITVFQLSRCWQVFIPASEDSATLFGDAWRRELPRRITPIIEILDEVFPPVALAYRRAGITAPVARVGIALEDYDDEPDALADEICRRTSPDDLKLDFRDRAALGRFLQEYEALLMPSDTT
jgi:hypothetical protein